MNISYTWLQRYLDIDLPAEKVSEILTSIGLETDGTHSVESIRGGLRGLVVGKVLTCEAHPDSDHLHLTTVDVGGDTPLNIVCGAPNVAAGQSVIVATVGTTLYDGDKEIVIKRSKIRGAESLGMICAEDEIGVGTSHAGIIVLPEGRYAPGTPAAEVFDVFTDDIIEVELTPNRIDAASHYGVARDLAAWLTANGHTPRLRKPSVEQFRIDSAEGGIPVEVIAADGAPRYSGITLRGVTVKESPEWLRNLLTAIGQRPINNIVDITNFILHGLGQPMHCFDLAHVKGDKIVVRRADEGQKFVTLDGIERTLSAADLMICNAEEPMCIAGVFGGLDSGVTDATTDVFLESAYFNPTSIRKSARRHGLSTDASFRFERGIDPNGTVYALKLAALLVKELAGGTICGPLIDCYPQPIEPFAVELSLDYLRRLIGKDIPTDTVKTILHGLEIEIAAETDDVLQLRVPTYRVDVQRPCDVVEDVLRIYGYNNVEFGEQVKSSLSIKGFVDEKKAVQTMISEQLTGLGFNEILNNSLTAAAYYAELDTYPAKACVELLNPLSTDLNVVRQTLIFGGLESIAHNINRRSPNLRFYEFGNCYSYNADAATPQGKELAPYSEHSMLGIWLTGRKAEGSWAQPNADLTIYDLKAVVENILRRLGISSRAIAIEQFKSDIYSAALRYSHRSGQQLATLGIVSRKLLKMTDVEQDVFYAELDWNALIRLEMKNKVEFAELPKSMPVKRDLSLLLDKAVAFADVERTVQQAERKLLRSVQLFDVYEGRNLEAGKKSYAISLTLQDDERTLKDKEIEKAMSRIIAALQKELGAQLR